MTTLYEICSENGGKCLAPDLEDGSIQKAGQFYRKTAVPGLKHLGSKAEGGGEVLVLSR